MEINMGALAQLNKIAGHLSDRIKGMRQGHELSDQDIETMAAAYVGSSAQAAPTCCQSLSELNLASGKTYYWHLPANHPQMIHEHLTILKKSFEAKSMPLDQQPVVLVGVGASEMYDLKDLRTQVARIVLAGHLSVTQQIEDLTLLLAEASDKLEIGNDR